MVMDASPLQPTPHGLFSDRRPSSHTEDRVQMNAPGHRNQSPFYACSVASHFPPSPLHLHSLSPEPRAVLAWLQRWGNIFTFLPSFS